MRETDMEFGRATRTQRLVPASLLANLEHRKLALFFCDGNEERIADDSGKIWGAGNKDAWISCGSSRCPSKLSQSESQSDLSDSVLLLPRMVHN